MLGKNFAEVKLKRNDKVKSLSSANKCFKIRDDVIAANPQQQFNRIICIATTTSRLKECLCYELSPYLKALFDEVSLRKTAKSQPMTVLARYSAPTLAVAADTYFVIDGGHLLHKVVWQQPAGIYAELYGQYCSYLLQHYRIATVVFHGYFDTLTKKSEEHRRRATQVHSADIIFHDTTKISTS